MTVRELIEQFNTLGLTGDEKVSVDFGPPTHLHEYRVVWQRFPRCNHPTNVMFVKAESENDAKAIAKDHIERRFGYEWFGVDYAEPAPALPAGEVLAKETSR